MQRALERTPRESLASAGETGGRLKDRTGLPGPARESTGLA